MLLQRWEVKIRQKKSLPQPGIELTTTRSWVWHAYHWGTRMGRNVGVSLSVCCEKRRKCWYQLFLLFSDLCFYKFSSKGLLEHGILRYMQMVSQSLLTLSQTSPDFYVSAVQVFWKHCRKRRNWSSQAISPFPTVFSNHLGHFPPFS